MAVAALRWFKAALFLQLLLLAYFLAIEVADLFPWNDVASRPAAYDLGQAIAVHAFPQLALIGIFALGVRWLATVSALGYAVYLARQLWIWWLPYIAGAEPAWRQYYAENFERTLKLFPSDGLYLAPDAQHLTLQLLTLATTFATFMAAARMRYL
jgi:hypothetical protein